LLIVLGVALACSIGELATRGMTRWKDGVPYLGPIRLQPFRPDRARVERELTDILEGRTITSFDPTTGWTLRPSCNVENGRYQTDARGFRVGSDGARSSRGQPRILAIGDSFTFCSEVDAADSWPVLLEQGLGGGAEVLNLGVPAFGIDQAVLRYEQAGSRERPDRVILGLFPDDLPRHVNVFRCMLQESDWPLSKPRFLMRSDGTLELLNVPCLEPARLPDVLARLEDEPLAAHDAWCDPWFLRALDVLPSRFAALGAGAIRREWRWQVEKRCARPGPDGLDLTRAIVQRLRTAVERDGATLSAVFIPGRRETTKDYDVVRDALLAMAHSLGLEVADPTGEFRRIAREHAGGAEALYVGGNGHCTRLGNETIAQAVLRQWRSVPTPTQRPR